MFCRTATRGSNLAGRQGVSAPVSRNPKKDGPFQPNPYEASDLAFPDSFVGFRLFASVFRFCPRNDTRNVTRREGLPEFSCQRIFGALDITRKVSTETDQAHGEAGSPHGRQARQRRAGRLT